MTDLAYGAIAIVSIDVQQNGDATGTVALQRKFFVGCAGEFPSTALDGPFDVVGWHVFGLRSQNGSTKARIGIGITAAIFRGDADFFDQACENLAALCVKRALLVLNCGPFGMAGHGSTSYLKNLDGAGFAFRGDH